RLRPLRHFTPEAGVGGRAGDGHPDLCVPTEHPVVGGERVAWGEAAVLVQQRQAALGGVDLRRPVVAASDDLDALVDVDPLGDVGPHVVEEQLDGDVEGGAAGELRLRRGLDGDLHGVGVRQRPGVGDLQLQDDDRAGFGHRRGGERDGGRVGADEVAVRQGGAAGVEHGPGEGEVVGGLGVGGGAGDDDGAAFADDDVFAGVGGGRGVGVGDAGRGDLAGGQGARPEDGRGDVGVDAGAAAVPVGDGDAVDGGVQGGPVRRGEQHGAAAAGGVAVEADADLPVADVGGGGDPPVQRAGGVAGFGGDLAVVLPRVGVAGAQRPVAGSGDVCAGLAGRRFGVEDAGVEDGGVERPHRGGLAGGRVQQEPIRQHSGQRGVDGDGVFDAGPQVTACDERFGAAVTGGVEPVRRGAD